MRTIHIVFVAGVAAATAAAAFACSDYGSDNPTVKPPGETPDATPTTSPPQDSSPPPTPTRDVAALVTAEAAAGCAFYERCVPGFLKLFFGDEALCTTRDAKLWTALFSAPGVTVNKNELDACISKLATVDCHQTGITPWRTIPECNFHGSFDDGTACDSSFQCKSGSCFHPKTDGGTGVSDCGTCKARVAENADCSQGDCEPSHACATDRCVKYAEPSASCSPSKPCTGSHICVNATCQKPLGLSAPCDTMIGAPHPCDGASGLFCQPGDAGSAKGTCAQMGFVPAEQTCGFTTPTTIVQCLNSSCIAPPASFTGTCTAYVNDDATCSLSPDAGFCALPSACNAGKCGLKDPARCK